MHFMQVTLNHRSSWPKCSGASQQRYLWRCPLRQKADVCSATPIPPIATTKRTLTKGHVCFAPESGQMQCNSVCPLSAKSGLASLFDHLVGTREQRGWHRYSDRLGGLEVDHQLKFCRLLNRKIRRF